MIPIYRIWPDGVNYFSESLLLADELVSIEKLGILIGDASSTRFR